MEKPVDAPAARQDKGLQRRQIFLAPRSEEHTSELQSPYDLVCRLLLEKKKKTDKSNLPFLNIIRKNLVELFHNLISDPNLKLFNYLKNIAPYLAVNTNRNTDHYHHAEC